MLIDLAKTFDCFSYELLVAKTIAYGVEISFVRLVYDYSTNRQQRTKIGNDYRFWRDSLTGAPQGSILGTLLFNIYICDMFFLLKDMQIANYPDETTPYKYGEKIEHMIKPLENQPIFYLIGVKTIR